MPIFSAILLVTISQSTSFAQIGEADYPTEIILEITDGTEISDFTIFSGSIHNEELPSSTTWELLDTSGTRHYVDFTSDLEMGSGHGNWSMWNFEIEIDPQAIGPCSCTIIVSVVSENGDVHKLLKSIFISPGAISDFQFAPTLHIYADLSNTWSSEVHKVNAISSSIDTVDSEISYIIGESTNVKCSNSIIHIPDEAEHINQSMITYSEGEIYFEIDILNLSDGWYDILIFANNPSNQEFSYDCTSIRVDNVAPEAFIEGPRSITEGTDVVLLDASSTIDEVWGIQGLTYIWSVYDIEGGLASELNISFGTDERSIFISPVVSGIYEIKLTVSDKAGNIGYASQLLEVQNIAPTARLTIDGKSMFDNDEFSMSRDSTCIIDASGSIDTNNDADNLRYVWRVNNVPIYEGSSREFSWPEGVDDDFILTIEVIDDDSYSSMISLLVKDDEDVRAFPLPLIVLFLSAIFLTYSVINYRNKSDSSEIPKWT